MAAFFCKITPYLTRKLKANPSLTIITYVSTPLKVISYGRFNEYLLSGFNGSALIFDSETLFYGVLSDEHILPIKFVILIIFHTE